jgi:hypothetical protein
MVEAKVPADLKLEKAAVEGERLVAEADLGRVGYLATLMPDGRSCSMVVGLLLDPATVLLPLAATRKRSGRDDRQTAGPGAVSTSQAIPKDGPAPGFDIV